MYYVYFSLYMFLTNEKQESLVVVVVDYFYKLRFFYFKIIQYLIIICMKFSNYCLSIVF